MIQNKRCGIMGGRERGTGEVGEAISGGYDVEDQKADGLAGEGMRGWINKMSAEHELWECDLMFGKCLRCLNTRHKL